MKRGGLLPRPILRFRDGTALTPSEGFKLNFKPFRGPRRISCYSIFKGELASSAMDMIRNLIYGVKGYGGFGEWFDCHLDLEAVSRVKSNEEYIEVAQQIPECDVVLAFIPDEMSVDYEEDPYMPLKRVLSLRGIPSQMVEESTCRHLRYNNYVLFNLALSLYSKAGGTPWVLAEPLHFDCVIGIDFGGGGVVATSSRGSPLMFNWVVGDQGHEGLVNAILSCLRMAKKPRKIAFHKDGPLHDWELEAIRSSIEEASRLKLLDEALWCAFEVKSRFTPRLLSSTGLHMYNPEKGVYIQLDKFKAIVATTGFPERPLNPAQNPVRPIMVEVVDGSWWDFDFIEALTDVYWLSELHWASGFTSTRLPISTLYAKRICSFWRAGVKPSSKLHEKLWFL